MLSKRSSDYSPLLGEGQLGHGDSETSNGRTQSPPYFAEKQRKTQEIPWTLVVVILCTLVNVVLSLFPVVPTLGKEAHQADMLVTRQNIHLLRRPNQYIGFENIPRPSPPVDRQLNTYPILLSLVDAASPDTVFQDDFATEMVHSGTITPDDRKVRVTPTMSTIIQFRAIDWGMEICELHIDLPEAYSQAGQTGSLGLYRVNATVPLDTSLLSYNTRPARVAKVGYIPLGNGVVQWHRKFSCAMDEVLSFELSCLPPSETGDDSNCFVEWVQIKDVIPAIHMVQHSTM